MEYSEQSLAVAIAPWDRHGSVTGKGCALALLRKTEEGAKLLEEEPLRCIAKGYLYTLIGIDLGLAVCNIFDGNIGQGIHLIERAISRHDEEGYLRMAGWYRLNLAELYLQIISGKEELPFLALLKNLPILLNVMFTASSRIRALTTRVLENSHFDPSGHHVGRAQMILGLLYKTKKNRALALKHLNEAKQIISQFGSTPMLARIDGALTELGQL